MGRRTKPIAEQFNSSVYTKLDPILFQRVKKLCDQRRWSVAVFTREAIAEFVKVLTSKEAA